VGPFTRPAGGRKEGVYTAPHATAERAAPALTLRERAAPTRAPARTDAPRSTQQDESSRRTSAPHHSPPNTRRAPGPAPSAQDPSTRTHTGPPRPAQHPAPTSPATNPRHPRHGRKTTANSRPDGSGSRARKGGRTSKTQPQHRGQPTTGTTTQTQTRHRPQQRQAARPARRVEHSGAPLRAGRAGPKPTEHHKRPQTDRPRPARGCPGQPSQASLH